MSIIKATKKPVTISAIEWTGGNLNEVLAFTNKDVKLEGDQLKIFTLEGVMEASTGDYIIRGVKGEFYPCKPDIFKSTYDF